MISLYDIIKAANGQLFGEPGAHLFSNFCLDPQDADEGLLFVALKTEQGDTHPYIEEAIRNRASGVLCVTPPECDTTGVTVIMVRDTAMALMAWAHTVLGKTGVKVVGVAGTSGRSVTAEAISRVLASRYPVFRGDFDGMGAISIPLSLSTLRSEHQFAILKLDTLKPGDMADIVQCIQPDISVLTHLDCLHSALFEKCEDVLQEMRTLVDYLSPGGLSVINYDDPLIRQINTNIRGAIRTASIDSFGADLMAYDVVFGATGTGFDLRYGSERYLGKWTPLLGKIHLYAVLYALLVGLNYDIPVEEGLDALKDFVSLPGRMRAFSGINGSLLIDDTYSANPHSTRAALEWLATMKSEDYRLTYVMGDMDDLGINSTQGHRQIGHMASEIVNGIVTKGAEASLVGRAATDEGLDRKFVRSTYSARDTIASLQTLSLSEQDIVLVKGGRSAEMERVVEALLIDHADAAQLLLSGDAKSDHHILPHLRPSWVEIDTEALATNIRHTKLMVGDDVTLMAVVKANGYGHGAVTVAQTALLNGAEYLGVASIAEAMELRDAGIDAPVLVMSHMPVYTVRQAIPQQISVGLYDLEVARAYDRAAREVNGKLKVHVKIDTGMGRLGLMPDETIDTFRHMNALEHIEIEGIYTHFSVADQDADYTAQQIETFNEMLLPLRAAGFPFKYIHASNSAGMLTSDAHHFNMVRAGIMLYGLRPSDNLELPVGFQPVMTWKTIVSQVKTLPPGSTVGYGNTYRTRAAETIAILPVGYADGLRRSPQTWREVLIHGKRAPLIGRVSMGKIAVSVNHIPGVSMGDEVVLLGRQEEDTITADEVAKWLGTINYEVVTTILPRDPRK